MYIYIHIFYFLAVLGLSCNTWNLCGSPEAPECVGFVAVVHRLTAPQHAGSWFPNQGLNLCPLNQKVNS